MSTYKILIYLFPVLFITILHAQEVKQVESKVVSATVFTSQAIVTRDAKVNLPSTGEYKLVLSNLTTDFLDESVKISGKGTAKVKIVDVKVEMKHTEEINNAQVKQAQDKIDSLRLLDQESADKIAALESQKAFLESFKAEAVKSINQKIMVEKPSLQDWQNLLQFQNKNLTDIYNAIRNENIKRRKYTNQIQTIDENIRNQRSAPTKSYKEILVTVLVERTGTLNLQATYMVFNASWYPVYDSRVFTEEKNLELSYFGMVQQGTGEDWSNIDLTLSTAQTQTGTILPVLTPWYLGQKSYDNSPQTYNIQPYYSQNERLSQGRSSITGIITDRETGEPLPGVNVVIEGTNMGAATDFDGKYNIPNIPSGKYNLKTSMVGYSQTRIPSVNARSGQDAKVDISITQQAVDVSEVVVMAEQSMMRKDVSTSTVSIRGVDTFGETPSSSNRSYSPQKDIEQSIDFTDVGVAKKVNFSTYRILTKSNIPSDNTAHKVYINNQQMNIALEYKAIPKKSPDTFLKCIIANKTDITFMKGQMNVFLGDDFINKIYLNNITPNDTFYISLGTDNAIKVEKKLINKFLETKGFLTGKKCATYEYEISAVNNKNSDQDMTVQDQLPISQNEDVVVQVLTPKETELNMDKTKIITWKLNLKPGEKKVIPFKYSITVPSKMNIVGIE